MKEFNPQTLKNLRTKLGLTQNEFARKLPGTNFQAQHVFNWENSKNVPSLKTLSRIVDAYKVPFSYFFTEKE